MVEDTSMTDSNVMAKGDSESASDSLLSHTFHTRQ